MKKKNIIKGLMLMFLGIFLFTACRNNEEKFKFNDECVLLDISTINSDSKWAGTCIVLDGNDKNGTYKMMPGRGILASVEKGIAGETEELGQYTIYEEKSLNLYDIYTGRIEKNINIKEIADQYIEEKQLEDYVIYYAYDILVENGEYYLCVLIDKLGEKNQGSSEDPTAIRLTIDLGTEKIVSTEKTKTVRTTVGNSGFTDVYGFFFPSDKGNDLPTINGFTNDFYSLGVEKSLKIRAQKEMALQGCVKVQISGDALPKKNNSLYSLFSGLEKYQGKQEYRIEIYLENEPDPEEVLKLFLEEGQEISFEGFSKILSAEESIDGQEHEIHNFEEYYQWKKLNEKEKLTETED